MAYKGLNGLVTPSLARYRPCARQNVPGNPGVDVIQATAIVRMFMKEEDIIGKEGALSLTEAGKQGE